MYNKVVNKRRAMDIKELIIKQLAEKGEIKASDIVKLTSFSRVYIHRYFHALKNEGKIRLIGKANQAHYILAASDAVGVVENPLRVHRILHNTGIAEDLVLNQIKADSRIFSQLPSNIDSILTYAFTEMLNNAIEHSGTDIIDIAVERTEKSIWFDVTDRGVGIFNNIMQKKGLRMDLEAIQDLLKGKETTAPSFHSGEGIYFTSRLGDRFFIKSSQKSLIFDNTIADIFIRDTRRPVKGTKVYFTIGLDSKRAISDVFDQYTDDSFEFSKTEVRVKLFRQAVEHISRSQARRIVTGLDKFKTVELDFSGVQTIGQGFADEIFRVWHLRHPEITIIPKNMGENVLFMIKHVAPGLQLVNNSESNKVP
jgi:anti-sigma regulatory factor (Ser/Thr protein kinase)